MTKRFLPWAAVLTLAALYGLCAAFPDLLHHVINFAFAPGLGGTLLAWGPAVVALEKKHFAAVHAMKSIAAKADTENRDMSAEEQARFDKHKADAESFKDMLEVEKQNEAKRGGALGGVTVRDIVNMRISENIDSDPNRGFRSVGEYACAEAVAQMHRRHGTGQIDRRLLALTPSNAANEGSGADGGSLIPPGFSTNMFILSLQEDSLLPMTDNMPIGGNSMQIPKDETTPWGTNGLRAQWQGELTSGTPNKPVLGMMDLRLKKLLGFAPISNELVNDAAGLTAYLPGKLATSIRWKTNEAILYGSGAGVPIGALTALSNGQGAAVVVAKDAGQATGTLSVSNVLTMFARLPPGSQKKALWFVNNDAWPALASLTLGNYPMFLPMTAGQAPLQGDPVGTLLGRPVLISQHANTFSQQGDLMLIDLSYYQSVTKAEGITTATSMHLFFDADLMAFRVTFRVDGQPKLTAPITPAKGSNKLSPFVVLGAR